MSTPTDTTPVTAWDLLIESERLLRRIDQIAIKAQTNWEQDAERRLSAQLRDLFAEVGIDAVQELRRQGRIPSDAASRKRIADMLRDRLEPFAEIVFGGADSAAQHGRNRIISQLQRQGFRIEFTHFSERMRDRLQQSVFEASQRTLERMTGDVIENLTQSYEDGLGIDEAAQRLNEVFDDLQTHEAERIARTEINSRQNEGAHETMAELGVEYEQWWSAEDSRVRDTEEASHVAMHGQITRRDEPFSNGLMHPGDRSGGGDTIAEWINCRCRALPVIPPRGTIPPPGQQWWYADDWLQAG